MSNRSKKIFFALSIILPILLYCVYYYGMMVKNAPYRFADLQYIRFEYGPGDSLVNKYNSKTGDYQYATKNGNIKKLNMHLTQDNLLYLHRKAADLGFWNFPAMETGDTSNADPDKVKSLRFLMEFVYKKKTKKVLYDQSFNGDPSLKDANMRLIKEIQKVLDEREKHLTN
jgi:hypothetical protein